MGKPTLQTRLQRLEQLLARSRPVNLDIENMSATERVRELFELFERAAARAGRPFPFAEAQKKLEATQDPAEREKTAQLLHQKFAERQRSQR